MPCPRCHKLIDADQRYCPHCGADTDAILGPWLDVVRPWLSWLPVLLVALAFGAGLWAYTGEFPYHVLIGIGVGLAAAWWLQRRQAASQSQPISYSTEPLVSITSENGLFELVLTRAKVSLQITPALREKMEQDWQRAKADLQKAGLLTRAVSHVIGGLGKKMLDKIEYPLADIETVKYTDGALVFTYRKRRIRSFESFTVNQEGQEIAALQTFRPADAREFVRQFNLIHLRVAPKP